IEDKIESSSVMFHQKAIDASIVNKEKMKALYAAKAAANPNNGYSPKEPVSMKNIFVLKTLNESENIKILVNELKNNPNVEYAEPNYNFSIDDFEIEELNSETEDESSETSSTTIDVDDPLYSSQTNILQTNLDDVWDTESTGNGTQIIAILDTGVDYDHPDLAANIWSNLEEKDGIDGYDDDGNGYVDDFRGWDYHHQTNTPLDDNMHGTHVAGIAGAVGNNGIGIAGAAWNVKLMPLKVFQASGIGDAATIAQGIEYAYMNGATVLNMSFGSYAESFTMKAALENAYSTAILVAAAGNNAVPIGPCMGCAPFYPAAYSFIVGVEDAAAYSNFDQDGPVYSLYSSFLLNYEVVAPGTGILSTIPNGGYGTLTGTSMATPLVAGALSIYAQQQPEDSQELMFGNLINTSGDTYVDFLAAMNAAPIPDIKILTAAISDTIAGNTYQDFEPDSGETIHLYPTIKNYWGLSNGVKVSIEIGGNEFQNEYWNSIINITEPETTTGSVSAYATYQMLSDPLEFTIADDAAHNTQVEFILKAWDEEYPNQIHSIVFKLFIKSSIKLQGTIENDTILYADKEYLIDNPVIIKGANLIIKPGVKITFGQNEVLGTTGNLSLYTDEVTDAVTGITYNKEAKILALGTKDSLITFMTDSYINSALLNGTSNGGYEQGGTTILHNGQNIENPFYQISAYSKESIESIDPYNIPVMFNENEYSYEYINGEYVSTLTGTIPRRLAGSLCNYCQFLEGVSVRSVNLMNSKFQYTGSVSHDMQSSSMFAYKNNFSDYVNNYNPIHYWYTMIYNNIVNLHSSSNQGETTAYGAQWYSDYQNENNYFNLSKILWTFIDGTGYNSGLWDAVGFQAPNFGMREFEKLWIGTGSLEKLQELNIDATDGSSGLWEYTNPRLTPYEEAHAVVWKVEVNGINSFDNYLTMYNNPIGLGMQEFKVYFSREMDTSVNPRITYGVTQPFTQSIVDEFGTWSEDGKIYTVNHTVTLDHESSSDGINRIRVTEAIELGDGWEIPKEDLRFNILMQASGSASTGFFAEPGLGKIGLEWTSSSDIITDILGYNMYRYQIDADGVESTPVKLNETLIVEDSDESTTGVYYSDFDVLEGQTYYYKYKI
ncbi:S8 family serine peptidase, partial [Flavobacteriaceae bacterium]|nr:S8 family serine peptidase [Flavobacteriaceae bacterium]